MQGCLASAPRSVTDLLHPVHLARNLWQHRGLIRQLTAREVAQRYRGSLLGVAWSFLLPLIMLATYTFVFSFVLQSKFDVQIGSGPGRVDFALLLFAGMLMFGIFQETVGAAPTLIVGNSSFVKRVVFPLEVLPVVRLLASLVHGLIGFGILLTATLALRQTISPTIWLFPVVLAALLAFSLGVAWFVASLGVYIRDLNYIVSVTLTILFFLTPIFYPLSRLPAVFQAIMRANPLTVFVEESRSALLAGTWPNVVPLSIALVISFAALQLGYAWFMKTKRGFADVV